MTQDAWIALGWQLAGWLCAAILPALAVAGWKYLAAHTNDKRYELLRTVAVDAVTYAEQTIENNPAKRAAAIGFVQTYLDSIGVHLPVALIVGAVESAVYSNTVHGQSQPPA